MVSNGAPCGTADDTSTATLTPVAALRDEARPGRSSNQRAYPPPDEAASASPTKPSICARRAEPDRERRGRQADCSCAGHRHDGNRVALHRFLASAFGALACRAPGRGEPVPKSTAGRCKASQECLHCGRMARQARCTGSGWRTRAITTRRFGRRAGVASEEAAAAQATRGWSICRYGSALYVAELSCHIDVPC